MGLCRHRQVYNCRWRIGGRASAGFVVVVSVVAAAGRQELKITGNLKKKKRKKVFIRNE